jgi:hypothetical protein
MTTKRSIASSMTSIRRICTVLPPKDELVDFRAADGRVCCPSKACRPEGVLSGRSAGEGKDTNSAEKRPLTTTGCLRQATGRHPRWNKNVVGQQRRKQCLFLKPSTTLFARPGLSREGRVTRDAVGRLQSGIIRKSPGCRLPPICRKCQRTRMKPAPISKEENVCSAREILVSDRESAN